MFSLSTRLLFSYLCLSVCHFPDYSVPFFLCPCLLSLSAFWLLSPPQLVLPLFSHLISHLPCFSLVQCPIVFIQPRCQAYQLGIWRFSASFIVSLQDLSLSFLFFLSSSFCISLQSAQFAFCLSPQLNYTLLLDMVFWCQSASRFHVSLGMLVCKPWL